MDLPTVALTNVPSSTLVREADGFLLTQAGKRLPLLQPKHFQPKLRHFIGLPIDWRLKKELLLPNNGSSLKKIYLVVAEVLENSIENYKREYHATHWAKFYAQFKKAIFSGAPY